MNRRIAAVAVLASITGVAVSPQKAQAQTGAVLTGRIVDATTGAPIPEALVVVTSNSLQGEQSVLSDSSGFYRLPGLPTGIYNVQVFRGSYKPYDVSKVQLRSNTTIRVNAKLVPESADSMTVVVEAPALDVGSASTGMTMGKEFLNRVPLVSPGGSGGQQRSFESVVAAVPGAQADSRGTSVAGAASAENSYRIDGVSVGSPRVGTLSSPLSIEFLDEVQVVDGGYLPEYGRTNGGAITATTKSGSNEFHGSAWFTINPGIIQGRAKFVPNASNAFGFRSQTNYIGDFGASVGGKIIKDKLWYFIGFQAARTSMTVDRELYASELDDEGNVKSQLQIPGFGDSYGMQSSSLQAVGKLTWAANKDNTVSLTTMYLPDFNGSKNKLRFGTALNGSDTSMKGVDRTHVVDLALRWLSSRNNKRWNFDTTLAWHNENYYSGPDDLKGYGSDSIEAKTPRVTWSPNSERGVGEFVDLSGEAAEKCEPVTISGPDGDRVVQPCAVRGYVTGGLGEMYKQHIQRWQFRHTTAYAFQALGHHTVKAGVDAEFISFRNEKSKSGDRILNETGWYDGAPLQAFETIGVISSPDNVSYLNNFVNQTWSPIWGAFLQDSWNIAEQLTINAGARYDGQFITANDKVWLTVPVQLSPRVGLIWDPTKQGRSKIYANYARTYQGLVLEMAAINGSIEPKAIAYSNLDGCEGLKRDNEAGDCLKESNLSESDNLSPNRRYDAWGAAPTIVDPKIKPASNDEVVAGAEYEVIPGIRAAVGYRWRKLGRVIEDMSRDEGATFFIGNPGYGIGRDFPKAQRKYQAWWLSVERGMSKHWMASANYTMAFLEGNYAGFIKPEIDQLLPNITSDFDFKSLIANRYGNLAGDIRHQIKVFGAGELPVGDRLIFNLGGAFFARSGSPYSYLGAHVVKGPNESFLLPRGTAGRTPWNFNLNANAAAVVKLGKETALSLSVDVFNVLNLQTATAVDEGYSSKPALRPLQSGSTLKDLEDKVEELEETSGPGVKNDNFGKGTSIQEPRTWRFALRLTF